jgi:hypothetical protein
MRLHERSGPRPRLTCAWTTLLQKRRPRKTFGMLSRSAHAAVCVQTGPLDTLFPPTSYQDPPTRRVTTHGCKQLRIRDNIRLSLFDKIVTPHPVQPCVLVLTARHPRLTAYIKMAKLLLLDREVQQRSRHLFFCLVRRQLLHAALDKTPYLQPMHPSPDCPF